MASAPIVVNPNSVPNPTVPGNQVLSPTPYSISPQAYIALAQLNLQPGGGQGTGTPVSSYGVTGGSTPLGQSATSSPMQSQLMQALHQSLMSGSSLGSNLQNWINNPNLAKAYAGSQAPSFTPNQPANAWRLNFNAPANSDGTAGFGNGMVGDNSASVSARHT